MSPVQSNEHGDVDDQAGLSYTGGILYSATHGFTGWLAIPQYSMYPDNYRPDDLKQRWNSSRKRPHPQYLVDYPCLRRGNLLKRISCGPIVLSY